MVKDWFCLGIEPKVIPRPDEYIVLKMLCTIMFNPHRVSHDVYMSMKLTTHMLK